MNTAVPVESANDGDWSFKQRWLAVLVVFAAHVGLIFAFGDRKPTVVRAPVTQFKTAYAPDAQSFDNLENPTLFALPHVLGFGGSTWLRPPEITLPRFRWTEPPRFLSLGVESVESAFAQFQQASVVPVTDFIVKPRAYFTTAFAYDSLPPPPRSALRLGGGLAGRPLLNPVELPLQPATDLLTNSIVRVLVDADGLVTSSLIQSPGSGSEPADRLALQLAARARFKTQPIGVKTPTVGVLIFEWGLTVSATNRPATQP